MNKSLESQSAVWGYIGMGVRLALQSILLVDVLDAFGKDTL